MIAHVLSKLPKEEKYDKNFIAMTRRFGYSKQSIQEFKKELYDYWENNIKQEEEDQESDGEDYATSKQWQQRTTTDDRPSDLDSNWTNGGTNENDGTRP